MANCLCVSWITIEQVDVQMHEKKDLIGSVSCGMQWRWTKDSEGQEIFLSPFWFPCWFIFSRIAAEMTLFTFVWRRLFLDDWEGNVCIISRKKHLLLSQLNVNEQWRRPLCGFLLRLKSLVIVNCMVFISAHAICSKTSNPLLLSRSLLSTAVERSIQLTLSVIFPLSCLKKELVRAHRIWSKMLSIQAIIETTNSSTKIDYWPFVLIDDEKRKKERKSISKMIDAFVVWSSPSSSSSSSMIRTSSYRVSALFKHRTV